jgi:predicted ATP-grasp superfamily ATP-dependent carboligase
LILNGKIIDKVYFYNTNDDKNLIKKGKITNYQVTEKLLNELDDSIFDMIFDNLKYSGFACIDFTIKNENIIIFEINPRPGGSLIYNKKYFDKFIDTIISHSQ